MQNTGDLLKSNEDTAAPSSDNPHKMLARLHGFLHTFRSVPFHFNTFQSA
jgi:hypothetical protein